MVRRSKIILACSLAACTVAISAGVIAFLGTQGDLLELDSNATLGIMPGIDPEQRLKELQTTLDESMVAFSVNANPVFDAKGEGNLMIENPANNAKLLTAEVVLTQDQRVVYQSKAIQPGTYLDAVQLDELLQPGTYDAIVYLKSYNEQTHELIGQTGAQIQLTVTA